MGFLVSLFALLSPLRDPLVYSLYTGGLPFGLFFGDFYILLLLIKKNTYNCINVTHTPCYMIYSFL